MLTKVQVIQTDLHFSISQSYRDVYTGVMQVSAHDVMGGGDISNNLLLHLSLSYGEHSSLMNIVPHLFCFEVL